LTIYQSKEDYQNTQQAYIDEVKSRNERHFEMTGQQRLAFLHSYGCQQNVADGEKLAGQLAEMGFGFTQNKEDADLILFNTCAVREHAEDRVFGNVGALKHLKRANPELIIGLCGCMTQQERVVERIQRSYPFVDLIFGTHALHRLPELIRRQMESGKRVVETGDTADYIGEGLPVRRDERLKAWISIMYGCDNYCTYCIVPYVRGRERSRESGYILDEIRDLVAQGYREFTLLGQNVNSYGKGLKEEMDFAGLLRAIQEIPGDFRVRFMTSHPRDATPKLIDAIRDCGKVARHIHLPVQSGSDAILEAMNRGYTVGDYRKIIDYAREQIPGVTFTSDIIVGFPGETYGDFQKTLDLVKQVGYMALFTFIYSKRSGTRAAEMDDPIPYGEKSKWMRELLAVQESIGRGLNASMVGSRARVLAEGAGKTGGGYLTGRTDSNIVCDFVADESNLGQFVTVEIDKSENWAVTGHIVHP